MPETAQEQIQQSLRRLFVSTLVLYFVLAVVSAFLYFSLANQQDALAESTLSTNQALCTLRGDLVQRIESTKSFLRDHPEGIAGISPQIIRQGLQNQQRTVDALESLDCPPPTIPGP